MKEGWEERGETRKMGRGRREGKRQLLATTYFVSHVYCYLTYSYSISLPHLPSFPTLFPHSVSSGWKCGQNEKTKPRTVSLDWTPQQRREGV